MTAMPEPVRRLRRRAWSSRSMNSDRFASFVRSSRNTRCSSSRASSRFTVTSRIVTTRPATSLSPSMFTMFISKSRTEPAPSTNAPTSSSCVPSGINTAACSWRAMRSDSSAPRDSSNRRPTSSSAAMPRIALARGLAYEITPRGRRRRSRRSGPAPARRADADRGASRPARAPAARCHSRNAMSTNMTIAHAPGTSVETSRCPDDHASASGIAEHIATDVRMHKTRSRFAGSMSTNRFLAARRRPARRDHDDRQARRARRSPARRGPCRSSA